MNKKNITITTITFIFFVSAGIFVEISTPSADISSFSTTLNSFFSKESISSLGFFTSTTGYIKSDFIFILAIFILSAAVITLPISLILIYSKIFSLGFSAAFIFASAGENSLKIIFCSLLPRGLIRMPAYFFLFYLSIKLSKQLFYNRKKNSVVKDIKYFIPKYFLCLIIMAISSILEVFLLLKVL